MGIYIFNWPLLKQYLEMDDQNPYSSHDFGKDIIPLLLEEKKKLSAYPFKGYWKDVGTVQSLWEANMDLLKEDSELKLFERKWKIYSVNPNQPPQFISSDAQVQDSLVNEGCVVYGNVSHSVLFQGVTVGKHTTVTSSVIMPDVTIGEHVVIENAIVPNGMVLPDGAVIRSEKDIEEVLLVSEEFVEKELI